MILKSAGQCPLTLRPATREDVSGIKDIIFSVLREYGLRPDERGKDSDLNDLHAHYFRYNGFFGVAVNEENVILGTFGIYRLSEKVCELRKMYLAKEARGKGCGSKILDFAIAQARTLGYKTIRLETTSVLKEAIVLYRKRGFTEIGVAEVNERVDQAFELTIE